MKRFLWITATIGLTLLLAACGSTTPPGNGNPDPGDPDPTDPPPSSAECRVTVNSHVTVPTLFENGPEECDYFFPGGTTYRVTADIQIEPGTVLRFGRDSLMYVDDLGSIQAVGTDDERIRFEGALNTTGYWYGLCFAENRESRLENVDVVWAGKVWSSLNSSCRGGISGAIGDSEPVHIVRTRVFGSHTNGLNVKNLILGEFAGNAFGGNLDFGVAADASQVHRLDAASDYLGVSLGETNGRPYVHAAGFINEPGTRHVWHALNAPYIVSDYSMSYASALSVDDGGELLLLPGVHIYFGEDSALYLWDNSGLWAIGEPDAPVVLSGVNATRGSWRGVSVSSSVVEFQNVVIRWGGDSARYREAGLMIYGVYDSQPKYLDGVHIEGSAGCGLRIDHDDTELFLDIKNITFANNQQDYCGPPHPGLP